MLCYVSFMEKETPYRRLAGNSGVSSYRLGRDWIEVIFNEGDSYLYTYKSAGKENVEEMKKLARKGKGLSSFISRNVRDLWEKKS